MRFKFRLFGKKKNQENIYYEKELSNKFEKCRTINNNINLLIISDTHGDLALSRKLEKKLSEYKNYNLCCILGDISNYDYEIILKYVSKEKIVALLGNHDSFDLLKKYKLNDINGKIITINGIRIAGIQGSHKYKEEMFPSFTHQESIDFLKNLDEVDILLSHDRPFLIDYKDSVHDGLKGITKYLYEKRVPYNIHGHLHKNEENELINGTKVIGVYGCELIELKAEKGENYG